MKFTARTNESRHLEINWSLVNKYLSRWKPGTYLDIIIKRKKKTVSSPMRRYYFGVVMPILLEALGYDPDESLLVHRQLKIVFFGVQPDSHGIYRDKDIPSVFGDDSDVQIPDKQRFIGWIRRKAAEEGYYVPDPGE